MAFERRDAGRDVHVPPGQPTIVRELANRCGKGERTEPHIRHLLGRNRIRIGHHGRDQVTDPRRHASEPPLHMLLAELSYQSVNLGIALRRPPTQDAREDSQFVLLAHDCPNRRAPDRAADLAWVVTG